jgi:prepilin peptidase CpaA
MTALIPILPTLLFPALVIVAAAWDATTFTIPNWISAAAVLLFFPIAFALHLPMPPFIGAVIVGVLALGLGILMFSVGWIGGGDAKLFAACALWLGWPSVLPFMLWTSAAGGALAVLLLWGRKLAGYYPGVGPAWFARLMQPGEDVPYGLAIAVGALAAFPNSALLHGSF